MKAIARNMQKSFRQVSAFQATVIDEGIPLEVCSRRSSSDMMLMRGRRLSQGNTP